MHNKNSMNSNANFNINCEDYGIELVKVDTFYPSYKLCHECGHKKVDVKLSDCTYHCEKCGYTADRNYNASLNLASHIA